MVTTAGGTASGAVGVLDDAFGLSLYINSTLTSTAVRVQVEPTDTGTGFVFLQSGGADVVVTSGTATIISPITFRQIRLSHSAAEAATVTVPLTKTIIA